MLRTTALHPSAPARASGAGSALLAGLAILMAFAIIGLAAGAAALAAAPRGIELDMPGGAADVPLDARFRATVSGPAAELRGAALFEAALGPDGRPAEEREVPLLTETIRAGSWTAGPTVALGPAEGKLKPDATYRLVVRGAALAPSPAGLRSDFEREARFATVRAPRPLVPLAPVRLKWGDPLGVSWDAPVEEVRVVVTPPAAVRGWVDPADKRRSFVQIEEPADGVTYRVSIVGARGANGVEARQAADIQVAYPRWAGLLDADRRRTLEDGKPLTLKFSQPIDRVRLETDPPLATSWQVDRRDPSIVEVRLDGAAQGTTYALTVAEAYTREGAPLTEAAVLEVTTPEALAVDELEWEEVGPRASVKSRPTLVFSQPVRDRRAAQAAITLDPPIAGRWEWLDDRRVRFTPQRPLPYDTEIAFNVKAGRDGPRAQSGAYIEEPATLALVTETDKVIDVDVTRQVMTLIQGGRTVRTLQVATGVPGADTPIGEFVVQYKMRQARFRGTNVDGSRYDIGDVNWILAFMGDYTIHGAYWRNTFGRPGSNGCVSLTDEDARAVYEWAPEGTRIKIHY